MQKSTLKTVTKKVEYCLREFDETRNSDIELTIRLWKEFYPKYIKTGKNGEEGIWLKDLFDLPREEHIRRIRAKIQNDLGKYIPTSWEVAKAREFNEDKWREAMGRNSTLFD